jgi:hypothetical protein
VIAASALNHGAFVADTCPSNPAAREEPPAATTPVDTRGALATYVNLCRVTDTSEEVVIDFALMAGEPGDKEHPLVAVDRVSLSLFTAKRLMDAIHHAIARHESTFGTIETSVEKRAAKPKT